MGMAASQARYLALTARKTNTEYEGQQINQERTALANQSADAFNQYLALEVPTAPSTQDYTTVQYTYQDGNVEEAIESLTELSDSSSDYNYLVTHYHYSDVFTGVRNTKINPQVRTETLEDGTQVPTFIGNTKLNKYVADEKAEGYDKTLALALEQIRKNNPEDKIATAENIYTYESYGRTYFATEEELLASANSGMNAANPSEFQANLNTYYAEAIKTKISTTENAFVEYDDTGRMTSISYENSTAKFVVNTETVTDQAAYQDAMNQYEYEKAQYEKAVEDINAKTKIIQEEDRTLELRLKQLDTEQNALQTEMEAVAKVIDKNVESTFKTFSS